MSDLKKWVPFQFHRHADKATPASEPQNTMARRPPYDDPFARMEREMNALMRGFFGGDEWLLPQTRVARNSSWFGDFAPRQFAPAVDVTNEAKHLVVSAELPGMTKEDVEVTFHDGALMLKGEKRHERKSDEDGCFRTERFYGSFQRTVPLPADVDPNGAEARFENGVLTVKFPKVELDTTGPRRIDLG